MNSFKYKLQSWKIMEVVVLALQMALMLRLIKLNKRLYNFLEVTIHMLVLAVVKLHPPIRVQKDSNCN